ncbi:hypothetical protein C8R47DRAFT_1069000 [Mycena vitilis]|nr:hypothetical protein C8R47DRAFT_1069000 [Mycena vitilis]
MTSERQHDSAPSTNKPDDHSPPRRHNPGEERTSAQDWITGGGELHQSARPSSSASNPQAGEELHQPSAGPSQLPSYAPQVSNLPEHELESLPTRAEYLYEEFRNSNDETPLAFRCIEVAAQSPTKFDFMDKGADTSADGLRKRFRLRNTVTVALFEVVDLLQLTIEEMCKLTGNQKVYQVDPRGVIRDAFTKGRDTIKEIVWAHSLLKSRLQGGVKVVDKLYLRDRGYEATSPASTQSSLWNHLDVLSPGSKLKGFLGHPAALQNQHEVQRYRTSQLNPGMHLAQLLDIDTKELDEAFATPPDQFPVSARFWNRQTGKLSTVGASSYDTGDDWELPSNQIQGRSERRSKSGGGAEVKFSDDSFNTIENKSYSAYMESSTTPLASSQPQLLPPSTPFSHHPSAFQATSTPFQRSSFSSNYSSVDPALDFPANSQSQFNIYPPNQSLAPSAAVAAVGGQTTRSYSSATATAVGGLPGMGQGFAPTGQTSIPPAATAGRNQSVHPGDSSIIHFLNQGGVPVKDIGVAVDNGHQPQRPQEEGEDRRTATVLLNPLHDLQVRRLKVRDFPFLPQEMTEDTAAAHQEEAAAAHQEDTAAAHQAEAAEDSLQEALHQEAADFRPKGVHRNQDHQAGDRQGVEATEEEVVSTKSHRISFKLGFSYFALFSPFLPDRQKKCGKL